MLEEGNVTKECIALVTTRKKWKTLRFRGEHITVKTEDIKTMKEERQEDKLFIAFNGIIHFY
jgi:hypothetical protein